MSLGINKVTVIGNIGKDPVIRYTPKGVAVVHLNIATGRRTKINDQVETKTEWHKVVLFHRLAEVAGQYLHAGAKVYIEGFLATHKYKDKQGIERYLTEIIAKEMQMLHTRHPQTSDAQGTTSTSSQEDFLDESFEADDALNETES